MDSKNSKKASAYRETPAGSRAALGQVQKYGLRERIVPIFITLVAFNGAWWHFASLHMNVGQLLAKDSDAWILLLYTLTISLAFYASFSHKHDRFVGLILSLLSALLILFLGNGLASQISELLFLISAFLLLLQISFLHLKSVYGLLAFSFMSGAAIPTAIFCLQNNHVDRTFLFSLIPLSMTFAFFLTPIFIPRGLLKSVLSMLIGLALIIYTGTLSLNIWFFLNILVLLVTWAVFINLKLRPKYHLTIYPFMMLLSILLLTAQMSR